MNPPIEDEPLGNEIRFPDDQKSQGNARNPDAKPPPFIFSKSTSVFTNVNLFPIYLKGWLLIFGIIIGIRCLFFINADYTVGEVKQFKYGHVISFYQRYKYTYPVIAFKTKEGKEIYFLGVRDLDLEEGEHVKVICKKNYPQSANVFTFYGFWFNWLFICGILSVFWFFLAWVLYGYK